MPSRLTGFVCPTVSMVTTGHATGVEKTIDTTCMCLGRDLVDLDRSFKLNQTLGYKDTDNFPLLNAWKKEF